MKLRDSIYTAGSYYLQMVSAAVVMLLQIPIALHYLSREQFGLWSFITQSLGYLLLLDLGVAQSVGRLMAEPLHQGRAEDWNDWFNLFLVVLTIQATMVLVAGWLLAEPILGWFNIPLELRGEAKRLWLLMLVLNAVSMPFRLFPGILMAQNRFYLAMMGYVAGSWVGLAVFWACLHHGSGVLAFGHSALAATAINSLVPLVAVLKGPHSFHLAWRRLPWRKSRELFEFSMAIFVINVAVQIVFLSQSLIIAKFSGLAAVASFTVCSRLPLLLMQLVWRPYDAFNPRWQILWCRGELPRLQEEIRQGLRLTMGLALAVAACCLAGNRWFVWMFADRSLYAGKLFDFFFALFMLAQIWNHCLGYWFVLGKRMRHFAIAVSMDAVASLAVYVLATRGYGLMGYVGAAAFYSFVGIGTWFVLLRAPAVLHMRLADLTKGTLREWIVAGGLLLGGAIGLLTMPQQPGIRLIGVEIALFVISILVFAWLYRHDIIQGLQRGKEALFLSRADSSPAAAAAAVVDRPGDARL